MTESTGPMIKMIAIDDEAASLELVADTLGQPGLEILTAVDSSAGWELVRREHPEIVLLDLRLPGISGMELLQKIVDWDPGIDVVLLTAHYSMESAVEAIQKGACDYLTKPISPAVLRQRMDPLLAAARKRRRTLELEGALLESCRFENMVGRSPEMLEVFARIRRVAPHFRIALITGETGTGKELAARALHNLSPSAAGRFVVCNCSAIVETLFESELFGHVKGAFTGATQDRVGAFEYASGGTIFLDEIGDMPYVTQSKLLRVLQDREIQRVGSPAVRKVDVRVVAATNRDLHQRIEEKQFREDLFYRLSMVEIRMPSLAERKEDLTLLEHHFLEKLSAQYGKTIRGISRRAQSVLWRHSWPGNVRELENVLGNAGIMVEGDTIDVHDLPGYLQGSESVPGPESDPELVPLAEMERLYTQKVLEKMGGNKVQTAKALGISRATLYSILRE